MWQLSWVKEGWVTFVRDKMDVISISSYLSSENVTRSVREAGGGARARREETNQDPEMWDGSNQGWSGQLACIGRCHLSMTTGHWSASPRPSMTALTPEIKGEGFIFLIIFASHVTRDKEAVFVNVQFPEVARPHVGSHSQICWRSALHSARVATNNLNWILKTQGTWNFWHELEPDSGKLLCQEFSCSNGALPR